MPTNLEPFDTKKDYYEILGARVDHSPREIEKLYKKQAHKRHPDRGGSEEDMKALNEAYRVLKDRKTRDAYDLDRVSRARRPVRVVAPAAREVGVHGQLLSALLCLVLGVMLLLLVRFNGLWFLWPLSILSLAVMVFGVLIAHSAMTNVRSALNEGHPARRFRLAQEFAFWSIVCIGGYGLYLILTWL